MKIYPTLYGSSLNCAVKVWSLVASDDSIIVTHGVENGKMQVKSRKVTRKNIGKANETTLEEQAILEAESKYKKQLDKGYVTSKAALSKPVVELPMLAHDYRKQGHRIVYPCFVQQKLDGVRCMTSLVDGCVRFMSRGGKYYSTIEIIERQLEQIFLEFPSIKLDGELYIHKESLQTTVSAVKKHNKDTKKVKYCIYDVIDSDNQDMVETDRWELLQKLKMRFEDDNVLFLERSIVNSEEQMYKQHDVYVSQGYEGIILRNFKGVYTFNHRSAALQKYKKFLDKEFKIVGHKVDNDGCIVWIVEVSKDVFCDVTPSDTKDSRRELVKVASNYYGKLLKVKFQAYTLEGSLQFPVGIELDRTDLEE